MAERHRIMISVLDADLKEAQRMMEREQAPRVFTGSARLPSYLSLLLERQIHNPSPVHVEHERTEKKRARGARRT
jgi:hypothetical protein